MCEFKSFILLRNGDILHHDLLQSHEDLISIFNLNDKSELSTRNFCRCEFKPIKQSDDKLYYDNLDLYELIIDEQHVPEWVEMLRESTIVKMKELISSYVINDSEIIVGKFAIIKGIVNKVINSEIIILNSGSVIDNSGSVIDNYGSVKNNYGSVNYNYGSVKNNYGSVKNNSGSVNYNYGTGIILSELGKNKPKQ